MEFTGRSNGADKAWIPEQVLYRFMSCHLDSMQVNWADEFYPETLMDATFESIPDLPKEQLRYLSVR